VEGEISSYELQRDARHSSKHTGKVFRFVSEAGKVLCVQ